MKASLFPKMSIFNLKGKGYKRENAKGGGGGRLLEGRLLFEVMW